MTLAEKLYEEGWQKGQVEGRQEGRQIAVLSALETRFGIVPAELRRKIFSISDEDRLSEALRRP